MRCFLCALVGQWLLNGANWIDRGGNMLLLGDADETISARTARAREAGVKWAAYFCAFLTWAAHVITFGHVTGDHCTYALNAKLLPTSREIWDWNTGKIRYTPRTIVDDIELPGA